MSELLGVLAQLQDGGRPDVGGEFGVDGFVGEGAERTRGRDLFEEVGVPPPDGSRVVHVDESRLVDDVRSGRERIPGLLRPFFKLSSVGDLDDRETCGTELLQIVPLVLDPPTLDGRCSLIVLRGPQTAAPSHGEGELREMAALEESDEVARAQHQPAAV